MCIIIYKPKGIKMPDADVIKYSMENNPDGTGYMFNIPSGVFIRKGFFKHSEVLTSLKKDLNHYRLKDIDVDIAIHARIATAGLVKAENCHPFPISDHVGDLQSTTIVCKQAMVHNGMINICDDKHKNLSDTQIFVKDVMSRVELGSKPIRELIKLSIGSSKLLVFNFNGMRQSFGTWVKDGEMWYSNETYKERTKYVPTYKYNSSWDGWEGLESTSKKGGTYTKKEDKVDNNRCQFCRAILTVKNTADLTESQKFTIGLTKDEFLCDDCVSLYGAEYL